MTSSDQYFTGYRDGLAAAPTMTPANRERALREHAHLSTDFPYARGFIQALKESNVRHEV